MDKSNFEHTIVIQQEKISIDAGDARNHMKNVKNELNDRVSHVFESIIGNFVHVALVSAAALYFSRLSNVHTISAATPIWTESN